MRTMFAVIKTGGKQYVVKEGDTLNVEKLVGDVGASVQFEALLVSDEEGARTRLGKPMLAEKLGATIVSHGRSKKVQVVKYKPKVRYRKRGSHRQHFTKIKIGAIQ